MTSRQRDLFFVLLRKALWPDGYAPTLMAQDEALVCRVVPELDWKPVLSACADNAILGVVAPALKSFPLSFQPSQRQQDSVLSYTCQLARQRDEMHEAIAELFRLIRQIGVRPVLLKGEGLSALYPDRSIRTVGDIDVLVDEAHYEDVCTMIDRANGLVPDAARYRAGCEHHYHTSFKQITLEVHHCIADDRGERHGKRLNEWAEHELQVGPCRSLILGGDNILLPPVSFDIFYIFEHMCKHILGEGGGLRQLIDWGVYLHTVHSQRLAYDADALLLCLKEFDLLHAWQVLSGILHYQLGLPADEIPFYRDRLARKSQGVLLTDMVDGGNFGGMTRDYSAEQLPHGIKRSWLVARGIFRAYRKKRLLFPKAALVSSLDNFMIGVRCRLSALRHS